MRVAVVTTHPIQYQVPWFQRLSAAKDIDLEVFFAMIPDPAEQGREFGVAFEWDMPLLEGYRYQVLENVAKRPSLTEFFGCDTPGVGAALDEGRFDAVIVNGWVAKTCVQALWACRKSGTPCIVRGEANALRPRAWWKKRLHRLLVNQYDACLAIGANSRRWYLDNGISPSRIFDTPYCVDNDRFARSARHWLEAEGKAGLQERFGLVPGVPTLLFSGKFVEKKRPMDLVDAIANLSPLGGALRVQALLVGDGPLGAELRRRAEGLPIRFAGFLNQTEIGAAYAASDCLVLPSDAGETWGLVVNEAMASGLAAIVSDQVGCAIDLVLPGETGDVFHCGDVSGLQAAIERVVVDPSRLSAIGSSARARVIAHYNFERVVEGILLALESIEGRVR
jgi:glycosyltransferase involved in cell wall biosynthesis